jgi:hypothetical protein
MILNEGNCLLFTEEFLLVPYRKWLDSILQIRCYWVHERKNRWMGGVFVL